MSGQSVMDRITAAKYSLAGQGLAKSVCKATTEEVIGPKKKHLDYLIQCTNEPNVSIPQLANLLIERTQQHNWVIVFKSLVTVHNLMNYGNERFTQFLASNNCSFSLTNFLDKAGVQGYDMSTYIRRYAKYLNEKASSYRLMAFDFCKVKRGKDDGMLRTMAADKLLKTLPILQNQMDALLEFDASPTELTNGVINAAFVLLFKDLIRLFACYNDGIINLLEKYFDMNRKQCKEALDLYKKFVVRMDGVAKMLKVAETVGIDKGDIPDLAKAPSSLLEALEDHLKSLESSRKSGVSSGAAKPASVTSAINTFSAVASSSGNGSPSITISDQERKKIIEDENRQLQQMKMDNEEKRDKEIATLSPGSPKVATASNTNPFAAAVSTSPQSNVPKQQSIDLFGMSSPTSPVAPSVNIMATNSVKASDDLFSMGASTFSTDFSTPVNNPFAAPPAASQQSFNPWGPPAPTHAGFGNQMSPQARTGFSNQTSPQGFEGFGEVMKPTQLGQVQSQPQRPQQKLISNDLDASLASLAGSLSVNGPAGMPKQGIQWGGTAGGDKKKTGGSNFQTPVAPATMIPMNQTGQVGQPRPMGGGWPGATGGYGQQPPSQQPNDPFGAL